MSYLKNRIFASLFLIRRRLSAYVDVVTTLVDKEGSETPFEGRMGGNVFGGNLADFLDPAHEDDEVCDFSACKRICVSVLVEFVPRLPF